MTRYSLITEHAILSRLARGAHPEVVCATLRLPKALVRKVAAENGWPDVDKLTKAALRVAGRVGLTPDGHVAGPGWILDQARRAGGWAEAEAQRISEALDNLAVHVAEVRAERHAPPKWGGRSAEIREWAATVGVPCPVTGPIPHALARQWEEAMAG